MRTMTVAARRATRLVGSHDQCILKQHYIQQTPLRRERRQQKIGDRAPVVLSELS